MKYQPHKAELEIELTPLIDVIFLLLIFFIVASTLKTNEVETKINLPVTQLSEQTRTDKLDVLVTKEGIIYLFDQKVDLDKLEQKLREIINKDRPLSISIVADQNVYFQRVIKVMEIIKKLGIDNLSFVLKKQ